MNEKEASIMILALISKISDAASYLNESVESSFIRTNIQAITENCENIVRGVAKTNEEEGEDEDD